LPTRRACGGGWRTIQRVKRFVASLFTLCTACGGSVGDSPGGDASPDTGPLPFDAPLDADTGCEGAVSGLASAFAGASCTTTLRILARTNAIVGWNVQCGAPKPSVLTESEARAAFTPWTTSSEIPPYAPKASDYTMLRDGTARDAFVFYVLAGDWGGLAAVSARRGEVAFFGTVVWGGSGKRYAPATWRAGLETTVVCPFTDPLKLEPVPTAELTLDDARVAAVRDVVGRSPILRAVRITHTATSAVLTVYPLDVGTGTSIPTLAEYVVLIESSQRP
jgi:hypothetical protein